MRLGGISTSLVDWEGHVSAVLWFAGCNFRCQYCQNPELLPMFSGREYKLVEVESELIHMKRVVDSLILCGGEPTLQPWAIYPETMAIASELDLSTKLDTNGSRAWVIKKCVMAGLNKVSLDIKATPDLYSLVTGTSPVSYSTDTILLDINRTLRLFRRPREIETELEVRTTVVPGLNNKPEDIRAIVDWVMDSADEYTLQSFNNQKTYNPILKNIQPCSREEMEELAEIAEADIPKVNIRPWLL